MLKKLFHREQPDIPSELLPDIPALHRQKDVAGLVLALQNDSADVAGAAVDAIVSLYQHGDNTTRQRAEAAVSALIDACRLWRTRARGIYGTPRTRAVVAWKLIDAFGEIRAREAVQFLMVITDNRTSSLRREEDADDERHAARALGRIADPIYPGALEKLLNGPKDLREMVLTGLVENGDGGLRFLRGYLLAHSGRPEEVRKALEDEAAAGGSHASMARTILEEVDAAEQEAQRQREQERQAKEEEREAQKRKREAVAQAALEEKLAMYPLAAELAGLLGHPEWVVDNETIKPGGDHSNYIECLVVCKRLGLTVSENEEIETWMGQDSSVQWADVWFKGKQFKIDGGRNMYFGNEW